jgi:hypothetical protein
MSHNGHARRGPPPEPMAERQAVALAIMACEAQAVAAPDVGDWAAAAAYWRAMLDELRGGPCAPWFYGGGRGKGRRNGAGM